MSFNTRLALKSRDNRSDEEFRPRRTPERSLLAAVLGCAFCDLRESRNDLERRGAYAYLMGSGVFGLPKYKDYPFSAAGCCEALDFDLESIRRIAKRLYYNPTDTKFEY